MSIPKECGKRRHDRAAGTRPVPNRTSNTDRTHAGSEVAHTLGTLEVLTPTTPGVPYLGVLYRGKMIRALIDSGATANFVQQEVIEDVRVSAKNSTTVALGCRNATSTATGPIIIEIELQGEPQLLEVRVMETLKEQLILGQPWLTAQLAVLDYGRQCVYYGEEQRRVAYWSAGSCTNTKPSLTDDIVDQLIQRMPPHSRDAYIDILRKYPAVFKGGRTKPIKTTKHIITLKDDVPVRQKPYRYSIEKKRTINEEVEKMLEAGIIRRSTSAYSSPAVIVTKKDGRPRFCVDYRKLNEKTIAETAALPPIQDTVRELGNAKIFTTLDLQSGYWQVPLDEKSKKYTAFTTPDGGEFEFNVMPFGLTGAPGTFQKLMTEVLQGYLHQFAKVYLDDIIVYSDNEEEHLQHLARVLERLEMHGLRCSPEKCVFGATQLQYLGYTITATHNEPQTEQLKRIQEVPPPRTVKELRSFMGTANWVRDYVPRFAELAAPLTDLLSIKRKFRWTSEAQEAFDTLKTALSQPLKLSRPDPEKFYCLQVDASSTGMASVLFQEGPEGQRRIISCASAKFSAAEKKYHINEQETLAAVWGIKRYAAYLEQKPFTLYTDSRALTWLHRFKDERAKLTRWALMLQTYQFKIVHVPGRCNELPDHLSRYPEEEPEAPQPTDDVRMYPTINLIDDNLPLDEYVQQWQLEEEECRLDLARLSDIIRDGPVDRDEETILEEYAIRDGIIWRKKTGANDCLYVPMSARDRVVREYHDSTLSGHPGRDETTKQITKKYYWPRMTQDIAEFVKTCTVCAVTKRGALQPAAPLRPQLAEQPWETISVDVLGPYPETKRGYRFMLIAEDIFSKWIEVAPVPDGRIRTVLDFLDHYVFARWGYPRRIISDNGVVFRCNRWRRAMDELHIEHRTSPIYHQQSNPVERRVQELKKILRTRSNPQKPNQWDRILADALFCLRTRTSAATHTTPSELLLGYQLKRPGERERDGEAINQVERQAQEARRARVEKVRRRQIQYQHQIFPEERRAKVQFEVGDEVLAREPVQPGQPFHPSWSGPWRVTQVRGNNSYDVEKAGNIRLIHVNDLRAAISERVGLGRGQPPPDEDEPRDQPNSMPGPSQVRTDVQSTPEVQDAVPDPKAASYRLPGSIPALEVPEGSQSRPQTEAGEDVTPEPASSRNSFRTDQGCSQSPPAVPEPVQQQPEPGGPVPAPRRRRRAKIVCKYCL